MSDKRLARIEAAIAALERQMGLNPDYYEIDELWMNGPLDEGSFLERYGKTLAQVEAMDTLIVVRRSFRRCPDG